jgi:hypothetical protein
MAHIGALPCELQIAAILDMMPFWNKIGEALEF